MSDTLNEKVGSDSHEIVPVRDEKRPKLSIDVPTRNMGLSSMNYLKANVPLTPGSDTNRINILPVCSPASAKMHASPCSTSSKGKPFIKKLLSGLSFKFQPSASEVERYETQAPEAYSAEKGGKPSVLGSFSFSKLFSPRIRRTSSLPINSDLHGKSPHGSTMVHNSSLERKEVQHHISRSLSLPTDIKHIKSKSIKRMNSLGGVFRVIPSTPRVVDLSSPVADSITPVDSAIDGDGEDIPEEEAVCRICMTELSEGSNTLKLECSCKGELALVHQECAVKWFSIRGNRNCEVCGQEVENLSVRLLRVQSVQTATTLPVMSRQRTVYFYRFSHEMPVLVIISMLAYFCFLEQLLVADVGTAALAISVPFSCILGVFASLSASTMASYASHYIHRPRYVCWIWCCDERKYERHRVVEMEEEEEVARCVSWQSHSSRDCAIVEPTTGIMSTQSLSAFASSQWSDGRSQRLIICCWAKWVSKANYNLRS
ncbi:unnamed protein product [Musa hybrid cultivar]